MWANTFDAAASRPTAGVSDDRNAFVPYRRAAEQFRDLNKDEGESFSKADLTVVRGRRGSPRLGRRAP